MWRWHISARNEFRDWCGISTWSLKMTGQRKRKRKENNSWGSPYTLALAPLSHPLLPTTTKVCNCEFIPHTQNVHPNRMCPLSWLSHHWPGTLWHLEENATFTWEYDIFLAAFWILFLQSRFLGLWCRGQYSSFLCRNLHGSWQFTCNWVGQRGRKTKAH